MKKLEVGNVALATAVVALATITLAPRMLSVSTTGESLKKDADATRLVSDLKSQEITLGGLIDRMSKLPGVKGFVICNDGKDLLVTHEKYSAKKQIHDYPAGFFVRVNDAKVLAIIAEQMPEMKKIDRGEGHYFPI